MRIKQSYSHVIWDWNGTLFDDVDWCIEVINRMLSKRKLKTLQGLSEYHNVFCFPVIKYYENVGFDFTIEPFEKLSAEFISDYHSNNSGNCNLFSCVETILALVRYAGISQIILSASEISILLSQIGEFDIMDYFDEILGLSNIYAKSKIDLGLDYLARKSVSKAILIGDTIHDYEVANALGVDCVLIPNGHQSKESLRSCGASILDDISYVTQYLGLRPL